MSNAVIDRFLEFEETNHFFDVRMGDFYVWPYVRFSVYMKIEEILNRQDKRNVKTERMTLRTIGDILMNCTLKNPLIWAPKAECLFLTHPRRTKLGEKYKCLYTDDLAKMREPNSISMEFLCINKHFKPAETSALFYLDCIDVFPVLLSYFGKITYAKQLLELEKQCERIGALIKECFDVDLGKGYLFKMAQKRFLVWHVKKRLWKKILRKVQPKVIVEVVGYETNKLVVNEIAEELNIPTIELQHGVIGRGHVAYNYQKKHAYPFTPDYIFLFSEYWKKTARHPQDEEHVIVTGYPYLESMMKQYPKINQPIPMSQRTVTVLVISQPEFSKKLLADMRKMIECFREKQVNIRVIYKLHPYEYGLDNTEFEMLNTNGQVEVIKDSAVNLYSLFQKADIQVGVTSTALFEGLAYSLETFLLHYEKTDAYMGDVCQMNYAKMCENGYEVAEEILSVIQHEDTREREEKQVFFQNNALERINEEISRIMVAGK